MGNFDGIMYLILDKVLMVVVTTIIHMLLFEGVIELFQWIYMCPDVLPLLVKVAYLEALLYGVLQNGYWSAFQLCRNVGMACKKTL